MNIFQMLEGTAIVPVLEVAEVAHAAPLAKALWAGGVKVAELTMRTDAALEAMTAMQDAVPDMHVGMGTILNEEMLDAAVKREAAFLVTPGTPAPLLAAVKACGVPCLPGVATASEAMAVVSAGFEAAKFFPAVPAGGIPYLKSLAGPIKTLKFCPTGGIGRDDAADFLALPNVMCVGGSWIATKAQIAAEDWSSIESNAAFAASLVG